MTDLQTWVTASAAHLGLKADEVDVAAILDLARDAAHTVQRPAAPVSTFLAGYLAGLNGGGEEAVDAAVANVAEMIGSTDDD